jgi:hypothetical protein
VYCVADYYLQNNPQLTFIMSLTKTIQTCSHISFKHWLILHSVRSPKWLPLLRFPTETLYSLLQYSMHATWHVLYFPLYDYVNINGWTVTDMKLTTESSASLYSYLHLTPNIFLTTLHSQNPQSAFFPWHKTPNFTPTQNDRSNVTFVYQYMNVLNSMAGIIARTYPVLFWWQFKII